MVIHALHDSNNNCHVIEVSSLYIRVNAVHVLFVKRLIISSARELTGDFSHSVCDCLTLLPTSVGGLLNSYVPRSMHLFNLVLKSHC